MASLGLEGTGRIPVKVAVLGEEGTLGGRKIFYFSGQKIQRSGRNEPQKLLCRFPLIEGHPDEFRKAAKSQLPYFSWPFPLFYFSLLLVTLGLCCCVRAFSRRGRRWLFHVARGSGVAAHGLSCSAARGILPGRGWALWPRHWQGGFLTTVRPGKSQRAFLFPQQFSLVSLPSNQSSVQLRKEAQEWEEGSAGSGIYSTLLFFSWTDFFEGLSLF